MERSKLDENDDELLSPSSPNTTTDGQNKVTAEILMEQLIEQTKQKSKELQEKSKWIECALDKIFFICDSFSCTFTFFCIVQALQIINKFHFENVKIALKSLKNHNVHVLVIICLYPHSW